jgi:hypothetical protein
MMMAGGQKKHWRAVVGTLAVAGLALGLSLRLEGAAHVPGGLTNKNAQNIAVTQDEAKRAIRATQAMRAGEPQPVTYGNMADLMSGNIPTFPVIVVDYRDDDATRMREAGLLQGPLPLSINHNAEGGVAAGGCSFDVDCDDGDPCTVDTCDFTPGQPAGSGTCVSVPGDGNVGNPQCPGNFGLLCGGCDDGLFCNGVESCSGGVCVAGTPPCTGLEVCSETLDLCQDAACTTNADCQNAGVVGADFAAVTNLRCNGTETCVSGVCVAGSNPCGAGGRCSEKQCSQGPLVDFCLTDEDCAGGLGTCSWFGPVCLPGRCCTEGGASGGTPGEPVCTRRTKRGICGGTTVGTNAGAACTVNADCNSNSCQQFSGSCDGQGGIWYGHDTGTIPSGGGVACPIINDVLVKCPKYGSGIAPSGAISQLLGPISDSPAVVSPFGDNLQKLGDDYELSNPGVCVGGTRVGLGCGADIDCPSSTCNLSGPSFMALDFLRFAGGSPSTDRISFEFYDEFGNFVEDLFFSGTAAFGIYPVLFDPPLLIPSKGYVVQRVAPGFSPNARHVWAATDAVDVGDNDPAVLWVNNGPASNFGTTGILAFELEGNKAGGNFGACCFTDPDVCENNQVPWVCRGNDGVYLGNSTLCAACDSGSNAGQYCRRCSNNTAQTCNEDSDCGVGNSCIPFNGACDGGGICVAEPACNEGGCCDPATGDCTVESEASCTGGGRNYLGNGTDCDADHGLDPGEQHCCPQPLASYSGADDCEDVFLHVITAPPLGETKVITITGNNENATNTLADPDSCFDPSDDPNADPGWWEGFTLVDDCTIVYIDHCCTDPVHRPAYSIIYDSCPCGSPIFSTPNPYAFPEPPFSRGGPYCADDDNLWQSFSMLGPGDYYYPIYSALAGNIGTYQLHISARACPTAACCSEDQCVDDVTQFECDDLGGFFLAPPNLSPAVDNCSGTNGLPGSTCYNGSCCTGPGECIDLITGSPANLADCDGLTGNFIGGVRCFGGTCSDDPLASCNNDAQCAPAVCLGDAEQIAQSSPCPVCEIEGIGNCQAFDNTLNFTLADRALGSAGLLAADDIRPNGDTLTQVCVWGFYLDGDPDASVLDCGPVVVSDNYRVRVYDTDPATGRSPGDLVGESTASTEKGIVPGTLILTRLGVEVYGAQLTLDVPITDLTPGALYWLEVSNDVSDSLDSCIWFWSQQAPDSGSLSFSGTNNGYGPTFESPFDMVFCTNFTFDASTTGTQPGACCTCDGLCSQRTLYDCANVNGVWDITEPDCVGVSCPVGVPANDDCADKAPITVGSYVVNNQCATTDGLAVPSDFGGSQIDFDVWYEFIAPGACDLVVSECQTGLRFDSMFAVYSNCPPDAEPGCDPTICPPCPLDEQTNADHLAGIGQDESCTGVAVGGPGIWVASEQILRNALPGECFLLRVGSFPGSRGTANLDIDCDSGGPGGAPNPVVVSGDPKVRFISFDLPNDSTGETALRVNLITLHSVSPPYSAAPTIPFTAFQGQAVWVGPPSQWVESAASGTPFMSSQTQCTPHYRDWNTVGTLHVRGSAIVPSSLYSVEHLSASCLGVEGSAACLSGGGNVSADVEIATRRWGDVETPFSPGTVQPDFGDVSSLVAKFRGVIGAPIKARALIAPNDVFGNINDATMGVDVGFTHISQCVDAFRGARYPGQMGRCTGAPGTACTSDSNCTGTGPCILYCP